MEADRLPVPSRLPWVGVGEELDLRPAAVVVAGHVGVDADKLHFLLARPDLRQTLTKQD